MASTVVGLEWVDLECTVLEWDRQASVVADLALVPADLLDLEGAAPVSAHMPADLPVVVTGTVPAEDLLAAVARKAVLKVDPAVAIVVVPKVDLATAEIADRTMVVLTMTGAAVTEDRIADLRVIAAARKTKRFSFG